MPTLFTPMDGDQDHQSDDHSDQHLFNPKGSSLTCTIFFKSSQDQRASDYDDHDQQKIKDEQLLPYQSSMNKNSDIVKHSREEEDRKKPTKWMSSKMRFMRKMMNPHNIIPNRRRRKTVEFGVDQQTNQDSTVIRVCSDCHTTKTPLWRTGPQGPKSLCNACGIRQRKARRVIAAAGTVGLDTGMIPADTWNKVEKQKRSNVDQIMPFKKRCKIITSQETTDKKKKHCFDLSKSSANLHSVLPQDERDAAILLMSLSNYGLICS